MEITPAAAACRQAAELDLFARAKSPGEVSTKKLSLKTAVWKDETGHFDEFIA